jgi:hypothetical protein
VSEMPGPQAYHVSLDVDAWGDVDGDEGVLPVDTADHDWRRPCPSIDSVLSLRWQSGTERRRPNLYWYPQLYHWVCDARAFDVLNSTVPDDIHVIARADVDGEAAWVIQVVTQLEGIVDPATSLVDQYAGYEIMQWPSFRLSAADRMSDRLFCVPEIYLDVFMGDAVKVAFDTAGLLGLTSVTVDWTNDLDWAAEPRGDESAMWKRAGDLASSSVPWPGGVPTGLAHVAHLLRFDRSMDERGLLRTLSLLGVEGVEAGVAAADYLDLPELAAAIGSLPRWTKATVDELSARYRDATADDAVRLAFARRMAEGHPG